MIGDKTKLFAPLPMNPLHLDSQIETTKVSSSTISKGLHHPYSYSTNLLSQTNLPPNLTIIEIIKPNKQKHGFIPAFAKPYIIQDSSFESATMMNLGPLKAFFLQQEETSYSQFFSSNMVVVPQAGPPLTEPVLPSSSSKYFQSIPSSYWPPPYPSAVSSFHSGKFKVGLGQDAAHQQVLIQGNELASSDSTSSNFETPAQYASSDDESCIHRIPDSPLLLSPIVQSRNLRDLGSIHNYPLTRVKVVFWVNELRRYLFLKETGRMSSAHAVGLHQFLCMIGDKMAHPFLTPQVLRETGLGKVMKSFRHGGYDARSKKIACYVTGYWRKVCLEA